MEYWLWKVVWDRVEYSRPGGNIYYKVQCKCKCWKLRHVDIDSLNHWRSKGCWCVKPKAVIHWKSRTKIYKVWTALKNRCNNETQARYDNYWGRWIKYDKKWESFEGFYEDMWDSYKEWLSIDRTNNNWNYSKENCKWITNSEQMRNTSRTVKITYDWKTMCVKDWCKLLWFGYDMIISRHRRWKTREESLEFNI